MTTNFINTDYPKYTEKVVHLTPKIYTTRMWTEASEETGSSSCAVQCQGTETYKHNLQRCKYRNSIQNQWLIPRNMKCYMYKTSKYENSVIYAQNYIDCPLQYIGQTESTYKYASNNIHRLLNEVKTRQAMRYRYLILVISTGLKTFKYKVLYTKTC